MRDTRFGKSGAALAALAVAAMAAAPAMARSADNLKNLVGSRGAGAESSLESRGWTYVDGHSGKSSVHAYWWSSSAKDCVEVVTRDGRIASIADTQNSDCNQKNKDGGGDAAGAAVAAAGVVALGALLLSHKKSHHDDGNHYDDQTRENDYERGYRDGLYNEAYHNADRSDAYSSGYSAGVQQRGQNTSYRNSGNRNYGGYRPAVYVGDLNGARAAGADSELQRRGFANVDGFKSGNTAYTIWSKRDTGQCLQMTVADGHVYDIRDIGTHPKC